MPHTKNLVLTPASKFADLREGKFVVFNTDNIPVDVIGIKINDEEDVEEDSFIDVLGRDNAYSILNYIEQLEAEHDNSLLLMPIDEVKL